MVGCKKLTTVLGANVRPAPVRVTTSLPLEGTPTLGVRATVMITPVALRTGLLRVMARETMESTTAGKDAAALAATTAPELSVKAALALVLALTAITGAATPDMELSLIHI